MAAHLKLELENGILYALLGLRENSYTTFPTEGLHWCISITGRFPDELIEAYPAENTRYRLI